MIQRLKTYWRENPKVRQEVGRIVRFGITGTTCSLIHYGVYCLILLFANYNIAYTGGYACGLIVNYFLTTYFTFRKKPGKGNLAGFIGSHILNYLLEMGLLNLFVWIGLGHWLAPICVMGIVVPINFLILQLVYTFKRKH